MICSAQLGLGAEWLAPRRCRELEPGLTPALNGGVLRARGGEDRSARTGQGAARRARRRGGRGSNPSAAGVIDPSAGAGVWSAHRWRQRSCSARRWWSATGAWSGCASGCLLHARPPVRPVKGQILELQRSWSRRSMHADSRLRAGLPGAARRRPPDRRRHGRGARLRHRRHRGRSPRAPARGLPRSSRRRRDGAGRGDGRPAAGDPRQPAAGRRGAVEGLVLATGHYRNGILLAPLTAAAVAAVLEGAELPEAVAAADPRRFAASSAVGVGR